MNERDVRRDLIEAAKRVFAAQSFVAATTREIAAEAEVSEGSIYRYFDSKEDLLFACLAELGEGSDFELPPVVPTSVQSIEDQLVAAMLRVRSDISGNYQLIASIWGDVELRRKFIAFARGRGLEGPRHAVTIWIRQGQTDGVFRSDFDAEAMMLPLSSVVMASILDVSLFTDADKGIRAAARVLVPGFTP